MTMNKRKAWVEEQQKQQAIQVAKDRILPLVLSLVFPFISWVLATTGLHPLLCFSFKTLMFVFCYRLKHHLQNQQYRLQQARKRDRLLIWCGGKQRSWTTGKLMQHKRRRKIFRHNKNLKFSIVDVLKLCQPKDCLWETETSMRKSRHRVAKAEYVCEFNWSMSNITWAIKNNYIYYVATNLCDCKCG